MLFPLGLECAIYVVKLSLNKMEKVSRVAESACDALPPAQLSWSFPVSHVHFGPGHGLLSCETELQLNGKCEMS